MTSDDTSFRIVAIHAPGSPHLPAACDGCEFVEVEPLFPVFDVVTGTHEHTDALGDLMFRHGSMTGSGTVLLPEGFVPDDAGLDDEITGGDCYVAAARSFAGALEGFVEFMNDVAESVTDAFAEMLAPTDGGEEVPDR